MKINEIFKFKIVLNNTHIPHYLLINISTMVLLAYPWSHGTKCPAP